MTTTFHIQTRSFESGESLIISDEFHHRSDAEQYMKGLVHMLMTKSNLSNLEELHTWFNDDFIIEIVEAEANEQIQTLAYDEAESNIWRDFARVLEFMEHTYSPDEEDSEKEEVREKISENIFEM
jgi:hypothetical protein